MISIGKFLMYDGKLEAIMAKNGLQQKRRRTGQKRAAAATVLTCAFCGAKAEGHYSIHRDGFGVGREVNLCDRDGRSFEPSCEIIWDALKGKRLPMSAFAPKEAQAKLWKEQICRCGHSIFQHLDGMGCMRADETDLWCQCKKFSPKEKR